MKNRMKQGPQDIQDNIKRQSIPLIEVLVGKEKDGAKKGKR